MSKLIWLFLVSGLAENAGAETIPKFGGRSVELIESSRRQTSVRVATRTPTQEKVVFVFQKRNEEEAIHRYQLGIGVGGAFNYAVPFAHAQLAVANRISLGLKPFFVSASYDDNKQLAYGGFLTATYFINRAAFRGFFLEGGAGLYAIETNNGVGTVRSTAPAGTLLFGWRGLTRYLVNLGFSGGLQYVGRQPQNSGVDYQGPMPFLSLDIGYAF
jgi:hypothetical protein